MVQDHILGLLAVGFGLVTVFVWTPLDTVTGLVEHVRGRSALGDALAPTIAGTIITAAGLWLAAKPSDGARISGANFGWLGMLALVVTGGLLAMRWTGPAIALLADSDYRLLRGTAPWKYIGFVLGGAGLVLGLMMLVERRFVWSRLLIALGLALALALGCDLVFEDLLLPPNGDV